MIGLVLPQLCVRIVSMASVSYRRRPVAAPLRLACVLIAAGMLAGCSSALRSMPVIGEPDYVPPPPAVTPDYPVVRDQRGAPSRAMAPAERAKREAELNAARTGAVEEKRREIQQ